MRPWWDIRQSPLPELPGASWAAAGLLPSNQRWPNGCAPFHGGNTGSSPVGRTIALLFPFDINSLRVANAQPCYWVGHNLLPFCPLDLSHAGIAEPRPV